MNNQADLPMGRILVADDDPDIRELITVQLEHEPFTVVTAASVAEIRQVLAAKSVDVVVLDLNLPDGDGLNLCRELRADGFASAIIMVTARGSAIDRVLGLELGADDYLTKPFEPRELVVRIRKLLRRHAGETQAKPAGTRFATIGPWTLDLRQRCLVGHDKRLIMLSASEYRLLARLIESPNTVLSREELLPERKETVAFDRSIDLQVSRLRQKLSGEPGGGKLIATMRNEGYILVSDVVYS